MAGVGVPGSVSVIGFNGTSLRHALRTRLTTFEVPVREMGEHAARAVIGGTDEEDAVPSALFVPRLIHGNTFRWADA
jgi:LacI family gluconate utilization system Gnt-I transcriptional repressor